MSVKKAKIWTDGGTASNIPPFGEGYGSFRIGEDGKIVTEKFKTNMSANAAEILTMARAVASCEETAIDLYSDSRIGLKWLKLSQNNTLDIPDNISEGMKKSIIQLKESVKGKRVKPHWRPRAQIFKIFGH